MQHTLCQVLNVLDISGNLSPQEHTHLILVVGTTQHIHNLLGPLAATLVVIDVELAMPSLVVVIQRLGSSQLNTTEGTTLNVTLHLQYPLDKLWVRQAHTYTPTGHVMTLRHRVELNTAVLGAWHLHNAHVLLAQDKRVRVIVHHHNVVILGKLHQSLVGFHTGTSACRHIGIVGPHQLHLREIHLLQLVEIRLPTVVLTQIVVYDFGTQNLAERCVGGIAGIGHQHLVARVYKGQGYMQYTLFRTNQRQYLSLPVELHVVPTLVEVSHGLAQFRCTYCYLIAVCIGQLSHLAQLFDGSLRWWHVGTTDSQ